MPKQRYKATYTNGQFRYFMADSAESARRMARDDVKSQRDFERGMGWGKGDKPKLHAGLATVKKDEA